MEEEIYFGSNEFVFWGRFDCTLLMRRGASIRGAQIRQRESGSLYYRGKYIFRFKFQVSRRKNTVKGGYPHPNGSVLGGKYLDFTK